MAENTCKFCKGNAVYAVDDGSAGDYSCDDSACLTRTVRWAGGDSGSRINVERIAGKPYEGNDKGSVSD